MKTTADRWCEACRHMQNAEGKIDCDWTAFDLAAMQPRNNGKWREPDAAAGIGWIEYMAWAKWREPKYLAAARLCADVFQRRRAEDPSPLYEVLLYYAPVLAARLNAEAEGRYDVEKLLNWCLSENLRPGAARPGWGTIGQRRGDYDCFGLQGSTTDRGGYAFAMNTFHAAGMVTPLVRYDSRYARAIGKWVLNVANAARLFYPDALPAERQSCPAWRSDPPDAIAYEGLRREGFRREGPPQKATFVPLHQSPYASGDVVMYGWPGETDLGVYGSAHVGYMAAIVDRTNREHILRLDLLATDFFHGPAYPTYLYFNPDDKAKDVEIDAGPAARDVYETTTHAFLARNVRGKTRVSVPADQAMVVVLAPSGGKVERRQRQRLIDGVVVDFGD